MKGSQVAGARSVRRGRAARVFAGLIALSLSPWARRLTLWLASVALLARSVVPGRLLRRLVLWFVRKESACCAQDSPRFTFLQARLEEAGSLERISDFMGREARQRAAAYLDAGVRVAVFATLQHKLLSSHLGTPGFPPRALSELQLALSPRCDLTCEGCYTEQDRGGRFPGREEIEWFVDQASGCGAYLVYLIGKGEPFLSPRWASAILDLVEARPHLLFAIATHGMHVDAALAARMGRLGNLLLLVSVDGPEEMHDARRGAGSYRRVQETLGLLREHRVLFGFSCMVSARSYQAVTSPEFIQAQVEAGCVVGIYSRYFPPPGSPAAAHLALDATTLPIYERRLAAAAPASGAALIDLDALERRTGCLSRAGESVYIDGITRQVAPCVRVPFAPADLRLSPDGLHLADALRHPFFVEYGRAQSCPSWCGANMEGELAAVSRLAHQHAGLGRDGGPQRRRQLVLASTPLPVLPPEASR